MDAKFTTKSQEAVATAVRRASTEGHPEVAPVHLLLALLDQPEGIATSLLAAVGADAQTVRTRAEALLRALPAASGTAFAEIARRKGDYAVCGAAVVVTVDDDLRVTSARAAYLSVGLVPEVHDLTDAVVGRTVPGADWAAAGALARGLVDPDGDLHASADYRRLLVGVLTERTLAEAAAEAVQRSGA